MLTGACVLAGVLIRRVIATERRAALLAGPQVDPSPADLHALFAFASLRTLDALDGADVGAGAVGHSSETDSEGDDDSPRDRMSVDDEPRKVDSRGCGLAGFGATVPGDDVPTRVL